jgi:hypothetical protein
MSIVLQGSTSGSITLQEPAVAGSTTLSLPATTGTVALTSDITSSFTGSNVSLTTNGFQKLPSGLILQWGYQASVPADGGVDVTFPIPFPTAIVNAQATGTGSGTDASPDNPVHIRNTSVSGMRVSNAAAASATAAYWFAIGY